MILLGFLEHQKTERLSLPPQRFETGKLGTDESMNKILQPRDHSNPKGKGHSIQAPRTLRWQPWHHGRVSKGPIWPFPISTFSILSKWSSFYEAFSEAAAMTPKSHELILWRLKDDWALWSMSEWLRAHIANLNCWSLSESLRYFNLKFSASELWNLFWFLIPQWVQPQPTLEDAKKPSS